MRDGMKRDDARQNVKERQFGVIIKMMYSFKKIYPIRSISLQVTFSRGEVAM